MLYHLSIPIDTTCGICYYLSMETTRTNLTLTKDMHAALASLAKKRGASQANLVREALFEYLLRAGYTVEKQVVWGGDRVTDSNGN